MKPEDLQDEVKLEDLPRDMLGEIAGRLSFEDRENLRQVLPEAPRIPIDYRREVEMMLPTVQIENWDNYIDQNNGLSATVRVGDAAVRFNGYFSTSATLEEVQKGKGHFNFSLHLDEYALDLQSYGEHVYKWKWNTYRITPTTQAPSTKEQVQLLTGFKFVVERMMWKDVENQTPLPADNWAGPINVDHWIAYLLSTFDKLVDELKDFPTPSIVGGKRQKRRSRNPRSSAKPKKNSPRKSKVSRRRSKSKRRD